VVTKAERDQRHRRRDRFQGSRRPLRDGTPRLSVGEVGEVGEVRRKHAQVPVVIKERGRMERFEALLQDAETQNRATRRDLRYLTILSL
jgi:hypothetical protein